MKTGIEEYYVYKNNKKMAFGYTTGTCAAAAAGAAAWLLLSGCSVPFLSILTPKGIRLNLPIEESRWEGDRAVCGVKKYAGDDPDVTDGVMVYAAVEKIDRNCIEIDGGVGVGRVTKPGLDQRVGNAAINRVPRQMIQEAVDTVRNDQEYTGGLRVVISIPDGVKLAEKTFNPRLGIVGGISVLGTSGIVEPMSEEALVASIEAEMRMRVASGAEYLLVAPGNYGMDFIKGSAELDLKEAVKCSNYVGKTVDLGLELGVKGILFVSHIGKFIKVAGGIMNTHSREADARLELLAAHGALAGADRSCLKRVMESVTTEDALDLLEEAGVLETVMQTVTEKIEFHLRHRAYDRLMVGAILFSSRRGELGRSPSADRLVQRLKKQGETE
ncbi:cobalt-precorrin-5B (C(1))-methyltransferase CbiD [Hominifimenecus sp. rT4P-3]|uniref:cobalt-precorrin-5B (C(1))-methyltransferase CbiD n=1 Tax=Hominifimenecus sp. rT4P-3 TaxID=3242979 RepID=UPI003DA59005